MIYKSSKNVCLNRHRSGKHSEVRTKYIYQSVVFLCFFSVRLFKTDTIYQSESGNCFQYSLNLFTSRRKLYFNLSVLYLPMLLERTACRYFHDYLPFRDMQTVIIDDHRQHGRSFRDIMFLLYTLCQYRNYYLTSIWHDRVFCQSKDVRDLANSRLLYPYY